MSKPLTFPTSERRSDSTGETVRPPTTVASLARRQRAAHNEGPDAAPLVERRQRYEPCVLKKGSNPTAMPSRQTWLTLVLITAGVEMLLLVAQYFSGLWTNVYAPAMFTSNSAFPSLNAHYFIGFALFFVGIVVVILAGLSRNWRLILGGIVVVVAVLLAGIFGSAFVGSSPNNPIDSFAMGAMFLVALFANSAILMVGSRARRPLGSPATAARVEPGPA